MLVEINCVLWVIAVGCIVVFVTMMFAHIAGVDDFTRELNVLCRIIIFILAIAFITFLISQHYNAKLMYEALKRSKSITY